MLENQIEPKASTTPVVVTLVASTATQLSTSKSGGQRGIVIAPDPGNTADIFVGTDSSVTNAVGWFAWIRPSLGPLILPVGDPSSLYLYTTGTGQKFGWAAL